MFLVPYLLREFVRSFGRYFLLYCFVCFVFLSFASSLFRYVLIRSLFLYACLYLGSS